MNERLDWTECATEYDACRRRVDELIRDAGESAASKVVPACPDWTVADLCAHLAGVPTALTAGDLPSDDTGAWVDGQVVRRRGQSVSESLDEWAAATPAFMAMMVDAGGRMAGLVLDAVAHEHDARHAVDSSGARDSRGVVLGLGFTKVLMDRDLRSNDSDDIVRFSCDAGAWQAGGDGEPTITLDLSGRDDGAFELLRALGSRRSLARLQELPWTGRWERSRDSIFHMPPPESDLVE